MSEEKKFRLNKDLNSFFPKGTIVTIVEEWGDSYYISNGFHRINAYEHELVPVRKETKNK